MPWYRVEQLLFALDSGQVGAELAQNCQPPFADDSFGILGNDAKHSAGIAGVVGNGTIREGMVGFFGVTATFEKQQERFVPSRLAGFDD